MEYCIYEYDFDTHTKMNKSEVWYVEIPCSTDKIIAVKNNKIACLKRMNENKITLVEIVMIRPFDDFVYIDAKLNSNFDDFQYIGTVNETGVDYYVYVKIVGKKEVNND